MKHELEKLTGPMLDEAERVKRAVKEQVQDLSSQGLSLKRYYILPLVLVASVCLFLMINTLLTENEQTTKIETALPDYIVPINEDLFNMRVFIRRYLNNEFVLKEYVHQSMFDEIFEHAAIISYMNYQGATLSPEEKENLHNVVQEKIKSINFDDYLGTNIQPMLDHFSITAEEYLEKEFTLMLTVNRLTAKSEEGSSPDLLANAKAFYYPFVEGEVRRFEQKYGFTFDLNGRYWDVLEKWMREPIEKRLDFLFDNTIVHFSVAINEEGEFEFADPTYTSSMFISTYGELMEAVRPQIKDEQSWGPLTHAQYKETIMDFANSDSHLSDDAKAVLQVFELLERSFNDDYDF